MFKFLKNIHSFIFLQESQSFKDLTEQIKTEAKKDEGNRPNNVLLHKEDETREQNKANEWDPSDLREAIESGYSHTLNFINAQIDLLDLPNKDFLKTKAKEELTAFKNPTLEYLGQNQNTYNILINTYFQRLNLIVANYLEQKKRLFKSNIDKENEKTGNILANCCSNPNNQQNLNNLLILAETFTGKRRNWSKSAELFMGKEEEARNLLQINFLNSLSEILNNFYFILGKKHPLCQLCIKLSQEGFANFAERNKDNPQLLAVLIKQRVFFYHSTNDTKSIQALSLINPANTKAIQEGTNLYTKNYNKNLGASETTFNLNEINQLKQRPFNRILEELGTCNLQLLSSAGRGKTDQNLAVNDNLDRAKIAEKKRTLEQQKSMYIAYDIKWFNSVIKTGNWKKFSEKPDDPSYPYFRSPITGIKFDIRNMKQGYDISRVSKLEDPQFYKEAGHWIVIIGSGIAISAVTGCMASPWYVALVAEAGMFTVATRIGNAGVGLLVDSTDRGIRAGLSSAHETLTEGGLRGWGTEFATNIVMFGAFKAGDKIAKALTRLNLLEATTEQITAKILEQKMTQEEIMATAKEVEKNLLRRGITAPSDHVRTAKNLAEYLKAGEIKIGNIGEMTTEQIKFTAKEAEKRLATQGIHAPSDHVKTAKDLVKYLKNCQIKSSQHISKLAAENRKPVELLAEYATFEIFSTGEFVVGNRELPTMEDFAKMSLDNAKTMALLKLGNGIAKNLGLGFMKADAVKRKEIKEKIEEVSYTIIDYLNLTVKFEPARMKLEALQKANKPSIVNNLKNGTTKYDQLKKKYQTQARVTEDFADLVKEKGLTQEQICKELSLKPGSLTINQKRAILLAHYYGVAEGYGIGNMPMDILAEKVAILTNTKDSNGKPIFNKEQRRVLIEKLQLTGEPARKLPETEYSFQTMETKIVKLKGENGQIYLYTRGNLYFGTIYKNNGQFFITYYNETTQKHAPPTPINADGITWGKDSLNGLMHNFNDQTGNPMLEIISTSHVRIKTQGNNLIISDGSAEKGSTNGTKIFGNFDFVVAREARYERSLTEFDENLQDRGIQTYPCEGLNLLPALATPGEIRIVKDANGNPLMIANEQPVANISYFLENRKVAPYRVITETDLEYYNLHLVAHGHGFRLEQNKKHNFEIGEEVYVKRNNQTVEKGWKIINISPQEGIYTLEKKGKIKQNKIDQIWSIPTIETIKDGQTFVGDPVAAFEQRKNLTLQKKATLSKKDFIEMSGSITEGSMFQQNVGNCYLIAALNSLRISPHFETLIRTSIEVKDGYWEVKIPLGSRTYQKYRVYRSDLQRQSNPGYGKRDSKGQLDTRQFLEPVKGPILYQILEAAFIKNFTPDRTLNRSVIEGGFGHQALLSLLGENFSKIKINSNSQLGGHTGFQYGRLKTFNNADSKSRSELFQFLADYDSSKYIATVNTAPSIQGDRDNFHVNEKEFANGHAYSIVEVDKFHQTVSVSNPWNTGKIITLTYGEFMQAFCQLSAVKIEYDKLFN